MAEKRKLPPRDRREPAAKKRVSEAATAQSQRKKTSTPRAPSPPRPVEAPLPTNIKDGEGLPIVRAPQPTTLSDKEYQSIAESAVLLASLERSKKKWLSDGILVRYYTKPKKAKREQIEKRNPPKESMVKVGPCDITVGPHLFDAMIYTIKDPNAPPPIQYAPPQRPMVHYGHPSSFQQYQPYPSPSNQQRPPPQYSPAPPGRPPHGYPGNQPPPPQQPRAPHQGHHAPSPQSGQRPPQAQNGQSGQPAKPSPDPVIQMLATRAAADPELKALMRVVASSQATQEQLRAFQAHIDELNAIIKAREQQELRKKGSTGTPQPQETPQQASQGSQNKPTPPQPQPQQKQETEAKAPSQEQPQRVVEVETPSKEQQAETKTESQPHGTSQTATQPQTPAQAQTNQPPNASQDPNGSSAVKQEATVTGTKNGQATAASAPSATPGPVSTPTSNSGSQQQSPTVRPTPPPGNFQQPAPRPGPPYPPYQQPPYGSQPPIQSRPPQYNSPGSYYRPPGPPLPPPRVNYKAVVFEFTSPLTPYGSSTSGHAGSGDRYLFPEYSILEWLPGENTVIASFLIVKKVDPNSPFPIEPASDTAVARGKGKGTSKSKKGEKKGGKAEKGEESTDAKGPNDNQVGATSSTTTPQKSEPSDKPDSKPDAATPDNPSTPNDTSANEANLKEYWQPVTFRIHATSSKILEPLSRVVKPADEVRKYMNEIMDRAERAPDGFPALRLPREEARESFELEGTPASVANVGASMRSRFFRAGIKAAEDESEAENIVLDGEEEEEEELKDFYDAPTGLPPFGA